MKLVGSKRKQVRFDTMLIAKSDSILIIMSRTKKETLQDTSTSSALLDKTNCRIQTIPKGFD
jgi:hypothetical protein